ncbi:STE3-domain-containing protein [Gyrodon lividus]|nr:STE3-domain-containing protein [Gyrodon lividus]
MQAVIPVISYISAGLVVIPLIWYLRARNIAAVAIGMWLSITNIIYAVDALIWAENSDIKALVWCDISTSFIIGSQIALPAACFCICIHLERLASFCQTSTPVATRRRILFECVMCFGLPTAYTALHLIFQPRRFDLFDGFGCRPATYPTVATIFLVWIPPFLLAFWTVLYAVIAWRHFLVHGVQFSRDGTRSSASSLTCNMYIRLVGMAVLEVVLSSILATVAMWYTLSPGLAPMADMPRHLNEVLMWGSDAMTDATGNMLMVEWTGVVLQSAVFFGLFACRMEALHQAWEAVRPFRQFFRKRHGDAWSGQGISIRSSMGYVKPTCIRGGFSNASISVPLRKSCLSRYLYLTLRSLKRPAAQTLVMDIP